MAEAVRRDIEAKEHEATGNNIDSDDNMPAFALDEDDDRTYVNSE